MTSHPVLLFIVPLLHTFGKNHCRNFWQLILQTLIFPSAKADTLIMPTIPIFYYKLLYKGLIIVTVSLGKSPCIYLPGSFLPGDV